MIFKFSFLRTWDTLNTKPMLEKEAKKGCEKGDQLQNFQKTRKEKKRSKGKKIQHQTYQWIMRNTLA
jgi:hypothetical protein